MPKKFTKKATQADASVAEEEKKPSATPKKSANEIDEIFAGKKRKKPENDKAKKPAGDVEASKPDDKVGKKNKRKKDGKRSGLNKNGNDLAEPSSWARKRTGDGLAIYTEEELGIGRTEAGATPLCPFDCDCCF